MKKTIYLVLGFVFITTFYSNCSKSGFVTTMESTSSSSSLTIVPPKIDEPILDTSYAPFAVTGKEDNVMKVTVGCGYVNQPCVDVTICQIGSTTACQTIKNLLLDTGSYGLRVFKSAVTIGLSALQNSKAQSIAECVSYADGTSQWGPVKVADIVLGGKRASSVSMQIIDDTFPKGKAGNNAIPSDCTNLDAISKGYNGILGVGLFTEDCGTNCSKFSDNRIYFACTATTCLPTSLPVKSQVSNPVSSLTSDNNGVILQLPEISSSGAVSAEGHLILGIGTRANNTADKYVPTFFQADDNGNFKTTFNGSTIGGFIDSGSNGIFFPKTTDLTACSNGSGFYCPTSTVNLKATQASGVGSVKKSISFSIANANVLLAKSNSNLVFNNLGGEMASDFDWGLPFFLGRSVYVGIEGKSSKLGKGPYWAY